METEARTRYSVRRSRDEIKKERLSRYLLWGLGVAACAVIVVFAALLLS
jgi:hypothetical protein